MAPNSVWLRKIDSKKKRILKCIRGNILRDRTKNECMYRKFEISIQMWENQVNGQHIFFLILINFCNPSSATIPISNQTNGHKTIYINLSIFSFTSTPSKFHSSKQMGWAQSLGPSTCLGELIHMLPLSLANPNCNTKIIENKSSITNQNVNPKP